MKGRLILFTVPLAYLKKGVNKCYCAECVGNEGVFKGLECVA